MPACIGFTMLPNWRLDPAAVLTPMLMALRHFRRGFTAGTEVAQRHRALGHRGCQAILHGKPLFHLAARVGKRQIVETDRRDDSGNPLDVIGAQSVRRAHCQHAVERALLPHFEQQAL